MQNKRYIFIGIIVLIIISGFLYLKKENQISLVIPYQQNYNQEKIENKIPAPVINLKKIENKQEIYNTKKIKVGLVVEGKEYNIETIEGSTVFETMLQIKNNSTEDNHFDFKYRDTAGLGSFINEINGVAGKPGKYWIYYVNNVKAQIGVSKYILNEGDIINWNQEGI